MTVICYGIPNCDTVKAARSWLDARGIAYAFHDYKKLGADPARLADWEQQACWQVLLNRTGTTFRKLPEAERFNLDAAKAITLMSAHPSCIKRPVVEYPRGLLVGFRPDEWAGALAQ